MSLGKNCAATTKERFGLSAFSTTIHSSFPLKMQTWAMNADAAGAQAWSDIRTIHLILPRVNRWLLTGSAFSTSPTCALYASIKCVSHHIRHPFLSRHHTLAILTKILCFPALTFQVLYRVDPRIHILLTLFNF